MKTFLSENITLLMAQRGLNLTELAIQLNIPTPTLHKIVTGKSVKPRPATTNAIAHYFDIPIAELLREDIRDNVLSKNSYKTTPLIEWRDIGKWINGEIKSAGIIESIPIGSLEVSDKSFALVYTEMNSSLFKPNSVLLFDPCVEVKDSMYALVKLHEYSEIIFRQIICDASNAKHIKSLNHEFSSSIKKLEDEDKVIAVLIMSQTFFY